MQSLEFFIKHEEKLVVPTTRVGSVMNMLSLISDCKTKKEFALQCARGIVGNFTLEDRDQLYGEFIGLFGEKIGR